MNSKSKRELIADMALEIGTSKPVTAWIEQYRRSGSVMNLECLDIAYQAMVKDLSSGSRADGSRRLRPSMIGNECWRAQAFSYYGAPQSEKEDWVAEKAKGGTLAHYWFQAEGMSAGWLVDIEVEVEIPEWHLKGALDGICKDGSVMELKTVSTEKYNGWRGAPAVEKMTEPFLSHLKQVHAYMLAVGESRASVIYLDRGEQRFREFRVKKDEALVREMTIEVNATLASIDRNQLPDRLFGCEMLQDGWDPLLYDQRKVDSWLAAQRWCSYKDICRHANPSDWAVDAQ